MAGLTPNGLSIKRLQEVRDEITANLTGFFGEDINTSEDAVFGQLRDSIAPGESSLWEQLQNVYDSQFPSRAEGQQLDDNCSIVGVFRKGNVPSKLNASVTGSNNTLVPIGFTVAVNTTQDEFEIVDQKALSNLTTTQTVISVDVISNNTTYTVTIDTVDATFLSDADATEAEIVAGLIAAIPIAIPTVTAIATASTNEILISSISGVDEKAVLLDTNISFLKVTTLISMQATKSGAIAVPLNQLTDIKTFVSNIDSVTNKEVATLGSIQETDAVFRTRRTTELATQGSSSVNAIRARINLVDKVRSVVVLENFTDSTDGNGLVAHSVKAIVEDGDSTEIAQALFDTKPVGIDMNGSVSVPILDDAGFSRNVLFERPTLITIFIEITLTKFIDYPSDGDTQIKNSLVKFGEDTLFAGDDVITSRLYNSVNAIQGHQIDSLFIGTSPSPTTSTSVSIGVTDLADILAVNITVI